MGAILDIILSLVIRGAIAVAILNMTIALQGKLSEKTAQANMFNLVATVSRILSNDMKMVGQNVSSPYFNVATQDSIEFAFADPPTSSNKHWIKYVAGDTLELLNTPNRMDRKLYRSDSYPTAGTGTRSLLATGVVTLRFDYYDKDGKVPSDIDKIKSFSVHLVMATGERVNGFFPAGEWTNLFFPSNIK